MAFFPINRRKFIRLAATAGVAAFAADAFLIEPDLPQLVRREILLRRWPERMDGFTIVQLSDFHYDSIFSVHPLKAAIGIVNDLHPDLIVLTGDFVSAPMVGRTPAPKAAAAADPCARWLKKLRAQHGLWAVMGNHDIATDVGRVTSALRAQGIRVLANQSVPVENNGGRFWLGGVNDVLGGSADLRATLHSIPADEATVLLAHEPDFADYVARYPIDLQLSGHSHGGQVRIPLIRPFYLPTMAKKYISGLFKIGRLSLYTNRGLGTVGVPVRFNCPPEITLMTIRRG